MKKIFTSVILMPAIVVYSGLLFIFMPVPALAGSLSASIFPSYISGMPLVDTATTTYSPCWESAQEFIGADYDSADYYGSLSMLSVGALKFQSFEQAQSAALNCLTSSTSNEGYRFPVQWDESVKTTVAGYESYIQLGSTPVDLTAEGFIYTLVDEYLVYSFLYIQTYDEYQTVSSDFLVEIIETLLPGIPHEQAVPEIVPESEPVPELVVEQEQDFDSGVVVTTNNGKCDYGEDCTSPDCENSLNCWIEWGCGWGGYTILSGTVGCIGTVAAELNKPAQIANIIQNVGCGIVYNFLSGLYEQNVEKVINAFISIAFTAIETYKMTAGTTTQLAFRIFQCVDGYVGFSSWFVMDLIPAVIGVISNIARDTITAVTMESPATLLITDSAGNQTGIDSMGNIFQEVPDAYFVEFANADVKVVLLPSSVKQTYTMSTVAENAGEIDIKVMRSEGEGEVEILAFNDIVQDDETTTTLEFDNQVGSSVDSIEIVDGLGSVLYKSVDEVLTEEVELPQEYQAQENSYLIVLAVIIMAVLVLAVIGVAVYKKRRG